MQKVVALACLLPLLAAAGSSLHSRAPIAAEPVEIWRDSLAVPHLWASSEEDLARAVGYVHAADRLWQMEISRRLGDGRLAELLGPDALSSDRFLRTLGVAN